MDYKDFRVLSSRRFNIPKEQVVKKTMRSFTLAEKAVFAFFAAFFVISGIVLLYLVNKEFLVQVPTRGGTISEGMVGNPRFINPVLAISEADKNLVSLIYAGLVRITTEGGVANDLASNIAISDDRLTYTVEINPQARFHDSSPVTADDVIFTIQKILDPAIKSPRRGNWDGVLVEKVDEGTVSFTLKQVYTPFLYNLSIGILPKHIWKNVSADEFSFSQFNTLPIGAGPYQVSKVERNSGGIPNYYELIPFEDVLGPKPFIETIAFRFYSSEEALLEAFNDQEIDSLSGISPENLSTLNIEDSQTLDASLPRVFALFFNQGKSKALLQKEVRQALDIATPKEEIIADVLSGFGKMISGPIPAGVYDWATVGARASTSTDRLEEARAILEDNAWKANPETGILEKKTSSGTIALSFSISTGDATELQRVAALLAETWNKLGAEVKIITFETGDLNQNVIRPRNFDALLFGEVVGRDADLYPFWHSSQRTDPGLNIALYANSKADKAIELARSTTDATKKLVAESDFKKEILADIPAIFIFSPNFTYMQSKDIKGQQLRNINEPSERFMDIHAWYLKTKYKWNFLIKDTDSR